MKTIKEKLNSLNINSKRLSLRKFSNDEIEYNVLHEMQPGLMKYIKDIESEEEIRKKTTECAQEWLEEENRWFLISLRKLDTNEYIGLLCLRYLSLQDHIVEIGWRLASSQQRNGYTFEAAIKLIHFLKNELHAHKLVAHIDSDNTASIKLAEKLGMTKEAHLKQHFRLNNIWRDEVIYSLIY